LPTKQYRVPPAGGRPQRPFDAQQKLGAATRDIAALKELLAAANRDIGVLKELLAGANRDLADLGGARTEGG
jgi:hypothetical protein